MLKAMGVEIKKEQQVLMASKTTSSKKKGKGKKKGNFKKNSKQVAVQEKKPKSDLSLRLSASSASRLVTGSGTAPSIWRIRRMAR